MRVLEGGYWDMGDTNGKRHSLLVCLYKTSVNFGCISLILGGLLYC